MRFCRTTCGALLALAAVLAGCRCSQTAVPVKETAAVKKPDPPESPPAAPDKEAAGAAPRLPVVYHPDYNITLAGMEKLHPFDSQKYGRVVRQLQQRGVLSEAQLVRPELPTDDFLRAHLDHDYLETLGNKRKIAEYTEMPPLALLPMFLIKRKILRPMLLATGGTVAGARLALQHGWAINLGGGYHHASLNAGGGFCIYPDITLAVRVLRAERSDFKRVMIIDLDAHQGNGHERDLGGDPRVFILDIYNHGIYPDDAVARRGIDLDVDAPSGIGDKLYLARLQQALKQALVQAAPQLVIYNAGTDILTGDPLGGMKISEQGVIKRDQLVFAAALERKVPILMVLSGGYQKSNAAVIARSVENLFTRFELKKKLRR